MSKRLVKKTNTKEDKYFENIIKCQSVIRGYLFRKKRLPNILYSIKNCLENQTIKFCNNNEDGRVNSCMDEEEIIKILVKYFTNRIYKPKARMWYDILVYDYYYGWIPVNIKSTTTLTSDNTGNFAMCVQAYTNETLDLYKYYQNGPMSKILFNKLEKKEYNTKLKKDYYFIVVNKNNNKDVIINSVKGLNNLTPNIHNLPFQVLWNKNRIYSYRNIEVCVKLFVNALQKPKPSWQETFMSDIRELVL